MFEMNYCNSNSRESSLKLSQDFEISVTELSPEPDIPFQSISRIVKYFWIQPFTFSYVMARCIIYTLFNIQGNFSPYHFSMSFDPSFIAKNIANKKPLSPLQY